MVRGVTRRRSGVLDVIMSGASIIFSVVSELGSTRGPLKARINVQEAPSAKVRAGCVPVLFGVLPDTEVLLVLCSHRCNLVPAVGWRVDGR